MISMFDGAACPSLKCDETWWRRYLTHCWASMNPFQATVGHPDSRGQRHTSTEGQCPYHTETDVGLCLKHYKEIVDEDAQAL